MKNTASPLVTAEQLEKRIFHTEALDLPYRLYVPAERLRNGRLPLVLFLHGAGERGTDNELQIEKGAAYLLPHSPLLAGAVIVVPQCPEGRQWVDQPWDQTAFTLEDAPETIEIKTVLALLRELKRTLPIDPDRVYVTGFSMGGYGTWDLLTRHGDLFAAGIPICGSGDTTRANLLKDIPIRTFHGLCDTVVPPDGTQRMERAVKALGGEKLEATYFPERGHDSWFPAYETEGIIDWLFAQNRRDRFPSRKEVVPERKADSGIAASIALHGLLLSLAGTALAVLLRKHS